MHAHPKAKVVGDFASVRDLASKAASLAAAIRQQREALRRNLEQAHAHRTRAVEVAKALASLAKEPDLPREVKDVVERIGRLTARQRQVFEKILRGEPNKVIAYDLGVSQKTVETHRARIMRKLGAGSLAELVRISLRGLRADFRNNGRN